MKTYGKEVILDIHNCSVSDFNRKGLRKYFKELCFLIDMKRCDLHFWDYVGEQAEYLKAPAHLKGTSAIQFISTSNITIHSLDEMKRIYINIFSCKDFDTDKAINFSTEYFKGECKKSTVIRRV